MTDAALRQERGAALVAPRSGAIAEHPWRWFFLIALLPTLIVALPGMLSYVDAVNVDAFAVLAALIVAWGCDSGQRVAPRTLRRVPLFAAVLAAWLALTVAVAGTPSDVLLGLPSAIITSFAVTSIYSPTAGLRELACPLLRVRASTAAWLVALLAWPVIAALSVAAASAGLVSDKYPYQGLVGGDASFLLRGLIPAFLLSLPTAIGWYGFAARRLLLQISPLVTALLVGVPAWLCVHLPASIWFGHLSAFVLYSLLNTVAVALLAVWVYQRSRGSLLPVLGLLIVFDAVPWVLAWAGHAIAVENSLAWLLLGLECALAGVLLLQGQMWRSPPSVVTSSTSTAEQSNA